MLSDYLAHVEAHPHTLLPRYLGFHRLNLKGLGKVRLEVEVGGGGSGCSCDVGGGGSPTLRDPLFQVHFIVMFNVFSAITLDYLYSTPPCAHLSCPCPRCTSSSCPTSSPQRNGSTNATT